MNKTKATPTTPITTITNPPLVVPAPKTPPLVGTSDDDEPVAPAPSAVLVPVRVVVPWSPPLLALVAVMLLLLPLPPGSAASVVLGTRSPGTVTFRLLSSLLFATVAVAVRVGISPYRPSLGVTTTKVDVDDSDFLTCGSCGCGGGGRERD